MLYTPAQYVRIYQDILTRQNGLLHEAGPGKLTKDWPAGPAPRSLDNWLHGRGKPTWDNRKDLANWVYGKYQPPWPQDADKEAAEYKRRGLERDESLQFGACFSMRSDIDRLLRRKVKERTSKDEWGWYVVGYAFLWGSVFRHFPMEKPETAAKHKEQKEKRQEIRESKEYESYQKISRRLIKLIHRLPQKKRGLPYFFLDFNLRQNLLTAEWNCIDPEQRSDLARKPDWRNFFGAAMLYLTKNSRDVEVVHNALAWASVFNRTGDFPTLRWGYITAKGKEPDWYDLKEFNDDFDHYRAWLEATLPKTA